MGLEVAGRRRTFTAFQNGGRAVRTHGGNRAGFIGGLTGRARKHLSRPACAFNAGHDMGQLGLIASLHLDWLGAR